jgi:hypothetical protein
MYDLVSSMPGGFLDEDHVVLIYDNNDGGHLKRHYLLPDRFAQIYASINEHPVNDVNITGKYNSRAFNRVYME